MPGVSIPIIDQLIHPGTQLLSAVLIPGGPFGNGTYTLVPPQNPIVALTYGFKVVIATVGAQRGKRSGAVDVYEDRLWQAAVDNTFLDGGIRITQFQDFYDEHSIFYWEDPFPNHLYVTVDPAVTLNFFYLQT